MEIWFIFQYLLRPPNEAGSNISLVFCAAAGGLKTNPRTLTVSILGLYRACPRAPRVTREPKFVIHWTLEYVPRFPIKKICQIGDISQYSPSSNVEERNRMEENEEDLGEEMDNGDNSEIINWIMRKEICRIIWNSISFNLIHS